MDDADLERALAVLEALAPQGPSVADVVDALEVVLDDPADIRTALDRAEAEGLLEREAAHVRAPADRGVRSDRRGAIVTKDGEFACLRCGRSLSRGYFLRVDAAEVGPYGSTCIRKVTGRD